MTIKHKSGLFLIHCALFGILLLAGCGYQPDTSAPERVEKDRVATWEGALIYIPAEPGPTTAVWVRARVFASMTGYRGGTLEREGAGAPRLWRVKGERSSGPGAAESPLAGHAEG